MSKRNYTQYSNNKKKTTTNAVPVETLKPISETVTPVELVEETVETVTLPETVEGVVVNCAKLNVRVEPNLNGEIICVLDVMSEIEIDVTKSTDEWLKICTATGVEGYCMRKFVDAYL